MKILVFGNPLVEEDNLALKLLPRLQKEFPEIEFKEFEPTENIDAEIDSDGKLKIIDVVEGIDRVMFFDDIGKLQVGKVYSMHDFDLGFNLKLFEKIGRLKGVEIIGVPMEMNKEKCFNQTQLILKKWVAQDMQGS